MRDDSNRFQLGDAAQIQHKAIRVNTEPAACEKPQVRPIELRFISMNV
jgi:hypothetical protein